MKNYELEIERLHAELSDSLKNQSQIINVMNSLVKQIEMEQLRCNMAMSVAKNMKYEILDSRYHHEDIFYPVIKGVDETLTEILKNNRSIARFGD